MCALNIKLATNKQRLNIIFKVEPRNSTQLLLPRLLKGEHSYYLIEAKVVDNFPNHLRFYLVSK